METAIKLEHVNKYFGAKQILHDVTFETYTGEVFGFLVQTVQVRQQPSK